MRPSVLVPTCLVLVLGCSSENQEGSLLIEMASVASTCVPETQTPPPLDTFKCALVRVCERARVADGFDPTCTPVPVVRNGEYDAVGPVPGSTLVEVDASGDFDFQLMLGNDEGTEVDFDERVLEITTELYDEEGVPRYRGIRTHVTIDEFFAEPLSMRVYPLAQSACAGPNPDGGMERRLLDRAFHAATRLPNGDVLIYGGVRGEAPLNNLGPGSIGSRPQPVVEIYRAQEDRVEVVENTFSRALFGSILLTQDPEAEQYRIYVSGGFDELGILLRYDVNQNRAENFYGSPLLVGEEAIPTTDAILTYDRATNSISVEQVDTETFGAVVAADEANLDFLPVVGGVTNAVLGAGLAWDFARNNRWISRPAGREDMSTMTMRSTGNADRFGHSVTLLPGNGQAFVWGGTIATSTGEALEMTAGQLIQPGGTITPVSGVSPRPTAFHTATALGAAEVMIIGGLRTSCIGTLAPCGQNGVTVLPADSPVVRLTVRADGSTDAFAFGSQPFSNSIFHTATRIDEDTLLMTGGSECTVTPTGCEVNTSLTETNRIFAVDISRGAYNDADDEIPAGLLQGRFGHQVTRLDVCPEGTIDCSDPRYLVTGGFVRVPEPAVAIEATRVGEVILMSRGSVGVLEFDEACNFDVGDAGMTDAGADSRVRDSAVDTAVVADTGSPDAATDAAGDGG